MPEHTTTLDAIATQIRSKNAGPFWMTLDVFFTSDDEYRWVLESGIISPAAIGDLYQVDPSRVRIFELANLHVIKVSFPRNVVAGSFDDRDLHAGQQHVLLAGSRFPFALHLPVPPSLKGAKWSEPERSERSIALLTHGGALAASPMRTDERTHHAPGFQAFPGALRRQRVPAH